MQACTHTHTCRHTCIYTHMQAHMHIHTHAGAHTHTIAAAHCLVHADKTCRILAHVLHHMHIYYNPYIHHTYINVLKLPPIQH